MELLFKNAVFNKGRNTTIRRGVKWDCCPDKENVLVYGRTAEPVACVKISTRVKSFDDLSDDDIANEHDPICRSWAGIYGVMKRVYDGFDRREIVTIVDFDMP